jgi:hypothetical protein
MVRQAINANKSSIHFSKNTFTARQHLSWKFFLSTPMLLNQSISASLFFLETKRLAFNCILDKVRNRMEGWRAKSFSSWKVHPHQISCSLHPLLCYGNLLTSQTFCSKLIVYSKNFWWGFPPKKASNFASSLGSPFVFPKLWGV